MSNLHEALPLICVLQDVLDHLYKFVIHDFTLYVSALKDIQIKTESDQLSETETLLIPQDTSLFTQLSIQTIRWQQ